MRMNPIDGRNGRPRRSRRHGWCLARMPTNSTLTEPLAGNQRALFDGDFTLDDTFELAEVRA
jgi:hypothetical protein